MNEASGFDPNSPEQQKPEIPEELLAAVNGYIDTIPVVSPDFLKSEMAARMITKRTEQYSPDMSIDEKKALVTQTQSSMNEEGVVEEIVQRLQDTGVIAKEAKDGAGFSVKHNSPEATAARHEASRSRADRLMGSKLGKTVLKPTISQTSEYVAFRTEPVKKIGGKLLPTKKAGKEQGSIEAANDTPSANNESTRTLRMPWTSGESERNPQQPLTMQEIRREINSRIAEAQLADSTETFDSLDNKFRLEVMREQLALLDDSEKDEFTEKFLAEFVDNNVATDDEAIEEPETPDVADGTPRQSSLSDRIAAARAAAAETERQRRQAEPETAEQKRYREANEQLEKLRGFIND